MASHVERGQARPFGRLSLQYFDYSVVIPNKVSMARDQLANDRNFLVFFRYACTLVILGFTMLVNFRLPSGGGSTTDPESDWFVTMPFGYSFIALGAILFVYSLTRYFRTQRALIEEVHDIEAGWLSYLFMVVLASFIVAVSIYSMVRSFSYLKPSNPT
ncbi:hypothetical protein BC940DRAFT_349155 [Gongronella butleri]|nr:hypothetical protein BC940DRAFT_349155 [Gongronella butleri]